MHILHILRLNNKTTKDLILPGVDAALLAAAPDDASLGSFLLADVVVVAADSLELEAAPKRMLAMSLGKALKPCSRTGFDSSRDLIWAFSCSICFVSLASSSVKPPWSLERTPASGKFHRSSTD